MKTTHNRFYKQKTPQTEKQRGLHPLKLFVLTMDPLAGIRDLPSSSLLKHLMT